MSEYVPGVCNIGRRGRTARATFGIAAIAFALAVWWALRTVSPPYMKLVVFLPLFTGFVSLFEATLRFCVAFARRGIYDLR